MPSLGLVLVIGSVSIFAVCGTGVALCREIMLDQVQRRLPEGQKIKYPYLSWKHSQIVQLHEQYFPNSSARAVSRFLTYAALSTIGTLAVYLLATVILQAAP